MKKLFLLSILIIVSSKIYADSGFSNNDTRFEKVVLSKNLIAECDAQKGDERGPFGITYKDGKITHDFLVMTGVYYDSCKNLERKINRLKRQQPKIILIGTRGHPQTREDEIVWRWSAVKSLSGKVCISYFTDDCE